MQRKIRLTPVRLLALVYIGIIFLGAVLLVLPFSTKDGLSTSFSDALFTATSATCVTGLIVYDTFEHWTMFGQIVILLLIQTGGIGFMTLVFGIWKIGGKKIGIQARTFMQESVNAPTVGGLVGLSSMILIGTLIFEGAGAFLLSFRFIPDYGWGMGIYISVFTSVSAFCNAGFDLMGINEPFSSLTRYSADPIVTLTVSALIIVGGIGFFVWRDLCQNKLHFKKYSLHTKLVLTTTAILIVVPFLIILCSENSVPWGGERVLTSLFLAVSPRTAGFNTLPLTSLRGSTIAITILLMFIGGSSGSTAGGIKTTTFATLILSMFSLVKRKKSVQCFGRRLDEDSCRHASRFITLFLCIAATGVLAIMLIDGWAVFTDVIFEVFSAIGTVGLSLGITPDLHVASQMILALLMYLGRVGCLTFMLMFKDVSAPTAELPHEAVRIG